MKTLLLIAFAAAVIGLITSVAILVDLIITKKSQIF